MSKRETTERNSRDYEYEMRIEIENMSEEELDDCLLSCQKDIKYRSRCLKQLKDNIHTEHYSE